MRFICGSVEQFYVFIERLRRRFNWNILHGSCIIHDACATAAKSCVAQRLTIARRRIIRVFDPPRRLRDWDFCFSFWRLSPLVHFSPFTLFNELTKCARVWTERGAIKPERKDKIKHNRRGPRNQRWKIPYAYTPYCGKFIVYYTDDDLHCVICFVRRLPMRVTTGSTNYV